MDLLDLMPPEMRAEWIAMENRRVGTARQAMWTAGDGYVIAYTTSRIVGGPFAGRFAVMAYRRSARARTGKAGEWKRCYYRGFSTRKAARARAAGLTTSTAARRQEVGEGTWPSPRYKRR